ncbi:MAG: hypothetical protein AB7P42_15430 [Gammaproteobacteria bacterium]
MSTPGPTPRAAIGTVLLTTRGRSASLGAARDAPPPETVHGWLREGLQRVQAEAAKLPPPPHALEKELVEVQALRKRLETLAAQTAPADDAVSAAEALLETLRVELAKVGGVVQQRLALAVKEAAAAADPLVDPPNANAEELAPVKRARDALALVVAREPHAPGDVDDARAAVATLAEACRVAADAARVRLAAEVLRLRKALTDALATPRLAEANATERAALDAVPDALDKALATVDAKSVAAAQRLVDGLPKLVEACLATVDKRQRAAAEGLRAQVGGKGALARAPEGALKSQADKLGVVRAKVTSALTEPLTNAKLETAAKACDELQQLHAAVTQAVADLGGAKLAKSLTGPGAFGDGAEFETLVAEGFGGDYKLAANLLKDACGGNVAKLKGLSGAFATTADRQRLGRVLSAGGLGARPQVLGRLLDIGCDGKAADFAALTRQLTAGDSPDKPAPDLANLSTLLDAGGLGAQPEVLGHLLKTGCPGRPADGPWPFQALLAEFGAAPASMKALLDTGGLAKTGGAKPVKPECLAHLLATGCDGNPKTLKTLAGNATALPKLKGLLCDGGLGDAPDSLGHLYKLGCGQDPAKLVALHDGFAGATAPKVGRLKSLLVDGGLNQKPKMLGDVLATGCGGDASKLVTMTVAFGGHMGELKEAVTAWGDDSGAAIKQLTDARHLNGDFAALRTQFTATLAAEVPHAPTRRWLLAQAPQFERQAIASTASLNAGLARKFTLNDPDLAGFAATDCDYLLTHVCERHLPSHFAFKDAKAAHNPINHSNTQFAKGTTPQQVADTMKATLTSADAKAILATMLATLQAWKAAAALWKRWLAFGAFRAQYPTPAIHQEHVREYKKFCTWYDTPKGRTTKGEFWRMWLSKSRRGAWSGPDAEEPPPVREAWFRQEPLAIVNDPRANPATDPVPVNPGDAPAPTDRFWYDDVQYQVGAQLYNNAPRVTQFYPVQARGADAATKLREFRLDDMTALRDAMT